MAPHAARLCPGPWLRLFLLDEEGPRLGAVAVGNDDPIPDSRDLGDLSGRPVDVGELFVRRARGPDAESRCRPSDDDGFHTCCTFLVCGLLV